jgi:hypothetical protein
MFQELVFLAYQNKKIVSIKKEKGSEFAPLKSPSDF